MKSSSKYLVVVLTVISIFVLTFVRTIEELTSMLYTMAFEQKPLAVIMHIVFLAFVIAGLIIKKARNFFFSSFLLILSGIAFVISIKYLVPPNIIIFFMFFILTLSAAINKKLQFDISGIDVIGKIIGFFSLISGFYYLHWVEDPIWINALFYSPLGIVNCPTMVAFCGLLIFLKPKGISILELFAGTITAYFGFFGIMRFGAYIDIILIFSGGYLLIRQVSLLSNKIFYKNATENTMIQ